MKQNFLLSLVLSFLCVAVLPAFGDPGLVPFDWTEDFEKGSISGWSSYPPQEDTAYDFTILPGTYREPNELRPNLWSGGEFVYPLGLAPPETPEGNRYYLLRSYRARSAMEQRIGVAYKKAFTTGPDFRVSFDAWIGASPVPVTLQVQLAGADGLRYVRDIESSERGVWQTIDLSVKDFANDGAGLSPDLEIQALAIVATYERGDPTAYSFFAVDNVAIHAERQAGFSIQTPAATSYKHWPTRMLDRHYHPGDTLDIEVDSEIPLERAHVRLVDFVGRAAVERATLSSEDGTRWIGKNAHVFTEADTKGPLTLVVEGADSEGSVSTSKARLWHLERPDPETRPRLLVVEEDRKRLVEKTRTEPWKASWEKIVAAAVSARKEPVPARADFSLFNKDTLLQDLKPYFKVLRGSSTRIIDNAWVYFVEGDEEAGEFAREGLLRMCGWETWTHPWFETQGRHSYYPVGIVCQQIAIAYDLLSPLLSVEDRKTIREGCFRNGIQNSFEEYFVDNRIPNHTSNWISGCSAGPLLLLAAFYEEGAEVEPYFSGLAEKWIHFLRATLKPDGSYGEGYSYQNFAYHMGLSTLAAMEHVFGATELVDALDFPNSYLFPLYIANPDGAVLDMGDSSSHLNVTSNLAWLVGKTRDPVLKWLYELNTGADWKDFLWRDTDIEPSSPELTLPPSRYFFDKGNVVFRTGWDGDATTLLFRAGPHFNHAHFDQGSFLLRSFGEELASEGGKTGYYDDPYYWSYFVQSAAHNTVLIDDEPESQECGDFENEVTAFKDRATITSALVGNRMGLVASSLEGVYRGKLSTYQRRLAFLDNGVTLVHDLLESKSGPHKYQFQIHPPYKDGLTTFEDRAVYEGKRARLTIHPVLPEKPVLRIKDTPIPLGYYAKHPETPLRARAVLQIENATASANQEFCVALIPEEREATGDIRLEPCVGEGYSGGVVRQGEDTAYEVYFSSGGSIRGAVETDARALIVKRVGSDREQIAAVGATSITLDEEMVLQSDRPIDALRVLGEKRCDWTIKARKPTALKIASERLPSWEGLGEMASYALGVATFNVQPGRFEVRGVR